MPEDKKICAVCHEDWDPSPTGNCQECGSKSWEYVTPDEVYMEDLDREDLEALEEELLALERSDPAVKKAAEEYRRELKKLARKNRGES